MGSTNKIAERKAKVAQYVRSRHHWRQVSLNAFKVDTGCEQCGYNEHPSPLAFHHRNPDTKVDAVSRLLSKGAGWGKIWKEIEKCDLLCSNCHIIERTKVTYVP